MRGARCEPGDLGLLQDRDDRRVTSDRERADDCYVVAAHRFSGACGGLRGDAPVVAHGDVERMSGDTAVGVDPPCIDPDSACPRQVDSVRTGW
jgi:hypothetical protein